MAKGTKIKPEVRSEERQAIQPVKVEPTMVQAINPRLSPLPETSQQAGLYNKHTNRTVYMSHKAAQRMVRANPNQFEIVS